MCLAIPGKVTEIQDMEAIVDYNGLKKRADLQLVPGVKIGDIVLVHAGFVINKLDESDGEELQNLVSETMKAIEL